MKIGLDVGSTTLKCVVIDDNGEIIYSKYRRHLSQISERLSEMLNEISMSFPGLSHSKMCISGSAGMGIAKYLDIPFTQEVYATRTAVLSLHDDTDVVIELGGEDAKILFLKGAMEVRMNGSCAGGTGAFIDQMATLLGVQTEEIDALASQMERTYTIASRCGVFAKSDIQSLLNQGATKPDIAASIFYAVVNQTVAGLAQGREIKGKVLYLGGPMTFIPGLRAAFDKVLKVTGLCPENSLYYVAYGAALTPGLPELDIRATSRLAGEYSSESGFMHCPPLFRGQAELDDFLGRHERAHIDTHAPLSKGEKAWIGVDAGSTTAKCVAVNDSGEIVYSKYTPSDGNPVPIVRDFLQELYERYPDINIAGAASTGYGEEIIKNAFNLDCGVVETVAHFTAAKRFDPEVDFIIDIGGQDIKCFKIRGGAIDNIFLNEACSSGCGSFLQTFAVALGYTPEEFASVGLFAEKPVDLGSRCTVFMNSSVKQAQKDGAGIDCISAGLSISVVKNALYKVIRVVRPEELGTHIVVQGGTFMNNAVLRSFEQETGIEVVRPNIAGLMGAYGAALYVREKGLEKSSILDAEGLSRFTHNVRSTTCKGCTNACRLTVNEFADGRRFIAGNRCERPVTGAKSQERYNIYEFKRQLLASYLPVPGTRGVIGIPLGLNNFEMLPFWHSFFTKLGFEVRTSPESTRELYYIGQSTVPSDTVCYPAKLMHGHIEALVRDGVDAIFYPCMTYNFDEDMGDNHFNCPVVAYYPEVIAANMTELRGVKLIYDYIGIHRRRDFTKKIGAILSREFEDIPNKEIKSACDAAYSEYEAYMERVRAEGRRYLSLAEERKLPAIVLAGRPYHLDREVNHGIDELISEMGVVVLSEDAVSGLSGKFPTGVLNQWTYHARMYQSAKYIAESSNPDLNLVQLISFGCGVDAVTSDEVRSILEESGRIYTQIKIDEITNLGAVKIRLRSLFAAIDQIKEAPKHVKG